MTVLDDIIAGVREDLAGREAAVSMDGLRELAARAKAAEAQRSHVEDSIRRDACDVDTETLRHTRPYELRCTKNQASYQRRVEQRERDLQNEAQLLE